MAGLVAGTGHTMRSFLVTIGGFWPDLLKGAQPLFPAQSITMFGTTAFLHGGPVHLIMNMIGLLWLGPIIVERAGRAAFWPIAGLCALGAGGLFALLANQSTPSVGASGVLFGFLGTVSVWSVLDRYIRGESLIQLVQHGCAFLAINLAITLSNSGAIAWEAHLGGFLAGAFCGWISWRSPYIRYRS